MATCSSQSRPVVLFTFSGRRPNIEVALPLWRRILAEHPNTQLDVWNLARDHYDGEYINTLSGERIAVRDEFPRTVSMGVRTTPLVPVLEIYRRYAAPEYEGCTFIKLDDDIVFLETERFGAFLDVIDAHPDAILSADVINNEAACAATQPELWEKFAALRIALRELHSSFVFADIAHNWFFDNHKRMLSQPIALVPTETWLSIHTVGYGWQTARRIAEKLDTRESFPIGIGGRMWENTDEAVLNLFPRIVMRGFTAAHLSFGGQDHAGKQAFGNEGHAQRLAAWRDRYAEIGQTYLESVTSVGNDQPLVPDLSPKSFADWNFKPDGSPWSY